MDELGKHTILIVDDEPDVVFFISKICQPQGYHTLTASSGLEALKYVQELPGRIDLVLLDLRMPGMGGLEVLKSIRQHQPDLPVIVLTALTDKRKQCEALGVEAYVTKPYSLEELYREITRVIGEQEESREEIEVPAGSLPKAKILIVDDEAEVCELLSEALTEDVADAEFEVRTATSGEEALRIANEFEPDLAVVDIKMQHMWGDELIEKFKQGAAYSPKDFVIFTGADVPEQREKARKSGYRVLTKPAKIDELIEVLKKICVRHKLLKKKP
ncbi:MAG: response regulator [Candidatus Omnitrophica bacterium]|nr:response regulator [Candidatus Omnitrophota bacterium]